MLHDCEITDVIMGIHVKLKAFKCDHHHNVQGALKKTTEYFLKFLFLFESITIPVNNGK